LGSIVKLHVGVDLALLDLGARIRVGYSQDNDPVRGLGFRLSSVRVLAE
jgi:hypothetical protein